MGERTTGMVGWVAVQTAVNGRLGFAFADGNEELDEAGDT